MYNEEILELLRDSFDVELLQEQKEPENEGGHLTYSIPGRTFARDGSGGEYILLKDDTVGYWGSEGQCGRLAESLKDCFTLLVNCPWWMDVANACNYGDPFESDEALLKLISELREEYSHIEPQMQEQAAMALDVPLEENLVALLRRFYDCATRDPGCIPPTGRTTAVPTTAPRPCSRIDPYPAPLLRCGVFRDNITLRPDLNVL